MKKNSDLPFFGFGLCGLLLGWSLGPSIAKADLPSSGFPLGRPNLPEVRTVKELRPGLTHVHVERGSWGPEGPPKWAFMVQADDEAALAPTRDCLERAGYTVREHHFEGEGYSKPYYALFAGEFDTPEDVIKAARAIPCPVQFGNPADFPHWDTGPWTIDIVIVDPKVYRGKVVSAWSGTAWRSSPLELAIERNAVVATNGSFFEFSEENIAGIPTGISIVEGTWHHEPQPPDHRAPMLFLDNDPQKGTSLYIGSNAEAPAFPEFKWANGKSVKLDGIDRMPKDNELVVIQSEIWARSPLSHYVPPHIKARQLLDDGYLSYGISWESGDLILMATGSKQAILDEAMGAPTELELSVPEKPGLNAWYVTPVFMRNGQRVFTTTGNFNRLSRTAIGADAEGKIYLISVDGTRVLAKNSRFGVTLAELHKIVESLGLVNAANLDGGPSSTSMVVEGKVMGNQTELYLNTPYTDRRRVGDVVLIIDDDA